MKKKTPLIIVDVQPIYMETGLEDKVDDIVEYIEKAVKDKREIFAFYNEEEFSGNTDDESRYFLLEQGLSDKAWGKITFIPKSYAFLRNWMDEGVSDEAIIKAVEIMKSENIHDTRDFTEEHWDTLNKLDEQISSDESFTESLILHSPTFDTKLLDVFHNVEVELIGGARYECLEEMKLLLDGYGSKPTVNEELTYGDYVPAHKEIKRNGFSFS